MCSPRRATATIRPSPAKPSYTPPPHARPLPGVRGGGYDAGRPMSRKLPFLVTIPSTAANHAGAGAIRLSVHLDGHTVGRDGGPGGCATPDGPGAHRDVHRGVAGGPSRGPSAP